MKLVVFSLVYFSLNVAFGQNVKSNIEKNISKLSCTIDTVVKIHHRVTLKWTGENAFDSNYKFEKGSSSYLEFKILTKDCRCSDCEFIEIVLVEINDLPAKLKVELNPTNTFYMSWNIWTIDSKQKYFIGTLDFENQILTLNQHLPDRPDLAISPTLEIKSQVIPKRTTEKIEVERDKILFFVSTCIFDTSTIMHDKVSLNVNIDKRLWKYDFIAGSSSYLEIVIRKSLCNCKDCSYTETILVCLDEMSETGIVELNNKNTIWRISSVWTFDPEIRDFFGFIYFDQNILEIYQTPPDIFYLPPTIIKLK